MSSATPTSSATGDSSAQISRLVEALDACDAVLVGAGAGLSTAAGLTYDGERFERHFGDFIARYGFRNMYEGGFHPFATLEEKWAYWSRYILVNRYDQPPLPVLEALREVVQRQEHFVITTNVDHTFQDNGFDPERLFFTQGDYGRWQCSVPCHDETHDNEATVRAMVAQQEAMRVPSELVPRCPRCGEPMENNLRADQRFVQDADWYAMAQRYQDFVEQHRQGRLVLLELGVGANTPGIIKYPFWRLTFDNPQATYACLNLDPLVPREITGRSIPIGGDLCANLLDLGHAIQR